MRFYNTQHPFFCGTDLHARMMYVCILDQSGKVLVHRNMKTDPEAFLRAIAPYRPDIVVAVEYRFTWYWLADIGYYETLLREAELTILKTAKQHDANTLYRLQTVPGIGKILSLVLLYEVHHIDRFPGYKSWPPTAA